MSPNLPRRITVNEVDIFDELKIANAVQENPQILIDLKCLA